MSETRKKPKSDSKLGKKILSSNADFLYSITSERLENQLQQIDSHNNKIIRLLGFSGTILTVLIAAVSILISINNDHMIISYYWLILPTVSFILLVIISLISYTLTDIQIGPDIKDVWKYSKAYEKSNMLKWASRSFSRAYYYNIRHGTKKKELAITIIIWTLLVQIISSIIAIIMIYQLI